MQRKTQHALQLLDDALGKMNEAIEILKREVTAALVENADREGERNNDRPG